MLHIQTIHPVGNGNFCQRFQSYITLVVTLHEALYQKLYSPTLVSPTVKDELDYQEKLLDTIMLTKLSWVDHFKWKSDILSETTHSKTFATQKSIEMGL